MSFYILTVGDSFENDTKIDSLTEFNKRLKNNFWYLYNRTSFANEININDKVIFYVSGAQNKKIFGSAEIKLKQLVTKKLFDTYTYNDPKYCLSFKKIERFNEPVLMKDKIFNTDFFLNSKKKNKKKWGVFLMGGVRKISKNDFIYLKK